MAADVIVENKARYVSNDETRAAVKFYLDRLLGRKADGLDVTVRYVSRLCQKEGVSGWCLPVDVDEGEFVIELDRGLGEMTTLTLLAHECVHVKQHALGELKTTAKSFSWQGKRYPTSNFQYWESPWEIEAYGREKGLVHMFCDSTPARRKRYD